MQIFNLFFIKSFQDVIYSNPNTNTNSNKQADMLPLYSI